MRCARRAVTTIGCWAALAAMLLAGAAPHVRAATTIEGEYQLMIDLRKNQRNYPWAWDSNSDDNGTNAQLRLFTTPRPNVEAFIKFEADWKNPENNTPRPEFQFREAHLRYRWDLKGRGVDSYLYSRQDRLWVDNYLIRVVESGDDNKAPFRNGYWGPNAQGVRVDTWGFLGLNTAFIANDFSHQYNPVNAPGSLARGTVTKTDDGYVFRARREFFKDRSLRLGTTWNRKVENQVSERAENAEVLAFDARYRRAGVDYSIEYASSRAPLSAASVTFPDQLNRKVTVFGRELPWRFPDSDVLVAEIRSLRVGTPRLGYFNFAPTYWRRGALYDNRAGDAIRDEVGFNLNGWYLLPDRAVTITSNYNQYKKRAWENRQQTELYNEAYIEFVNGFNGKTYYRARRVRQQFGPVDVVREAHYDAFFELQVESRLAWLRVGSKIKDIGQISHKQLFSVDYSINLTRTSKIYNRFVFGNDPSFLRKAVFLQLQYRPTGNMECFLEYGPNWIGDSNTPVDDPDLEGGGNQVDLIKFILKGNF